MTCRGAGVCTTRSQARQDKASRTWRTTLIASTNPLERLNGEIKRRADVIGIFPNNRAVVRLVGALMLESSDEWAVSRRYMSLESLVVLSDDPVLRLSAVAA